MLLTDDVVAVLIPHQRLQRTLSLVVQRRQARDDLPSLFVGAKLDTLLDDVARKFVLREEHELRGDDGDDLGLVFLVALLNHMLRDVVAVLIHDQGKRASVQLVQDVRPRGLLTMLEHALDDTAAVGMGGQTVDLACKGIDDELDVLLRDAFDGFLDDVIAILILDALENLMLEFFDEGSLLIGQDVFEGLRRLADVAHLAREDGRNLLYDSASVHLQGQGQNTPSHLIRQDLLL